MKLAEAIASQYGAALAMLRKAVQACPDSLWNDGTFENRFWHVAYHTLFYTHFYLQENESAFVPWEKARPNYNFMGPVPWPPHEKPEIGEAYTKEEILEYLDLCEEQVRERTAVLDPEAPSGFEWIPMNKLELQLYNLRHVQHHAGQLIERLRAHGCKSMDWIGMG
ncbi:MAG: DinB family protein [Planctomycetota bacterium]|jgi:hypothetical protein